MPDRRHDARADRRRQRGREDEARRVGAHRVDQVRAARDVAAEAAEGLRERALEHVDAMHLALARADAAAARAVHADRVHLVAIGHRAVFFGEVADRLHGRDVAVHRVEALERDQLRPLARLRAPAVLPDARRRCGARSAFSHAGLADALDHRVVVPGVGEDQAVGQQLRDGRNAGLVRHVARGEDERRLLAVQVGKLGLQFNQRMIGARDVARAARARAHARRGLDHRADHLRVLAHAEIVVGAPDHDVALALRRVPVARAESAPRCARGRRTRDSAARHAARSAHRRKRRRSSSKSSRTA